jgi:hypothetical protein
MRKVNRDSLVLCQSDPIADAYLNRALNICLDTLQSSNLFRDATVILTGSLARGEGSVISGGNDLHSLSDMEFLVSLGNSQSCDVLVRELACLEDAANEAVTAAGIKCKAEFTYALHRYYVNARPSIFAYELKTHGKLVQGDEDLLALVQSFSAKDIPRIDAFYLLCNRMVEQLERFCLFFLSGKSCPEQVFRYAILKGYVDIATSVLVFNRQFVPSYQGRRDLFCKSEALSNIGIIGIDRLRERVDYWTRTKLKPAEGALIYRPEESPLQEWLELATMVSHIWHWELRQLICGKTENTVLMQRQFIRFGQFGQIMRNRIKFLLTALKRKELNLSMVPFLAGNPRHVLYTEVGSLYRQLAQKSVLFDHGTSGNLELARKIKDIVYVWEVYFRNS